MENNIAFEKVFGAEAAANVSLNLARYRFSWRIETQDNGDMLVKGKAYDSFNFVNHPWLNIRALDHSITAYGCDCANARRDPESCEHCAAFAHVFRKEEAMPLDAASDTDSAEAELPAESEPAAYEPTDEPADDTQRPQVWNVPVAAEPEAISKQTDFVEEEPEEEFDETSDKASEEAPEEEPAEEPGEAKEEDWAEEFGETEEEAAPAEVTEPRSMEILFGHRLDDGSPVYWYPNDTECVFHTNTGVIGTMGTGKTQFTKGLITQIYNSQKDNYDGHPLGILIFDYKGDYNETKRDFCQATNAHVLKLYKLPINPLALNQTKSFRPLLPVHTANAFKDTISKIFHLGFKQQQTLMDSILAAYARQGIYPDQPETWSNPAPTFGQVYEAFVEGNPGRIVDSLTNAMEKLQQFMIFEDNPRKARSLSSLLHGVVVIDLSGEEYDIQNLVVAITLDQFYAQMQTRGSSATDGRYRQLRNLILVDEADAFMEQRFQSLRKIMKEGREFGVGVILSTQSLTHFVGENDDYSRYVLTWVAHNVSDLKMRDVERIYRLQPKSPDVMESYAKIKELKKHESIIKVSEQAPFAIRDKAFWELFQESNEGKGNME